MTPSDASWTGRAGALLAANGFALAKTLDLVQQNADLLRGAPLQIGVIVLIPLAGAFSAYRMLQRGPDHAKAPEAIAALALLVQVSLWVVFVAFVRAPH